MTTPSPAIVEIVRNDPRYPYEAYEFLFEALQYTQKMLGRVPAEGDIDPGPEYHVDGPELLRGLCRHARQEFGLLAPVVFRHWGIHRTDDVGEVVFNLIDAELLCQTEDDHRTDFHDVFDIERALSDDFQIELDEVCWQKRGAR